MCKDIWKIIFDNLDIKSQLQLRATCREFRSRLQIIDLFNIPEEIAQRLNDNIISLYPNLQLLNASNNPNITDNGIKHLRLHTLNANVRFYNNYSVDAETLPLFNKHSNYNNRISNDGIINMPLTNLFASNNISITNYSIQHFSSLKVLDASYNEGINDDGIKHLTNLLYLNANGNPEITDRGVENLCSLHVLKVNSNRSVTDSGLKKLTLVELDASWNPNITDGGIKHMPLKKIIASHNKNITIN